MTPSLVVVPRNRNCAIDLLRIVSAVFIVMLHTLSQGGVLSSLGNLTFEAEAMWLFQIIFYCGVNVFALVSGYIGFGGRHKSNGIISLWFSLAFYSVLSVSLSVLFNFEEFSFMSLLKALIPVGNNWYFNAYFALFFFMPLIDRVVDSVDRGLLKRAIVVCAILFMIVESVSSVKEFGVNVGYSAVWLSILYFIGAYMKKYNPFEKLGMSKCIVGLVVCVIITFVLRIAIELVMLKVKGVAQGGTKFISYTSPLIVMQAVFVLEIFSRLKITKGVKFITFVSQTTFGVFIIHTSDFVYRYLLFGSLSFVAGHSLLYALGVSIGCGMLIFAGSALIDITRAFLFKYLRISKLAVFLGNKLDSLFGKL